MQIKFLTIYNFYDTDPAQAQYDLLGFWQKSIVNDQINFIHKAAIEFKDYTFEEYPDQERLVNEIRKSVVSGYDSDIKAQFWFIGKKRYTSFEDLYNDLAEVNHLMELIITPEDC